MEIWVSSNLNPIAEPEPLLETCIVEFYVILRSKNSKNDNG